MIKITSKIFFMSILSAALLGGLIGGVFSTQMAEAQKDTGIIKARAFHLINEKGLVKGKLFIDEDGLSTLTIGDPGTGFSVRLGADENKARLMLSNKSEDQVMNMAINGLIKKFHFKVPEAKFTIVSPYIRNRFAHLDNPYKYTMHLSPEKAEIQLRVSKSACGFHYTSEPYDQTFWLFDYGEKPLFELKTEDRYPSIKINDPRLTKPLTTDLIAESLGLFRKE
jgi:hypothetical protein